MVMNWSKRWRRSVVASLLGALLLALLTSESVLPARDEAKPAVLPSDLAAIPDDSTLLLSGRVADVWNSEMSRLLQKRLGKESELAVREFENRFGLKPEQVERMTMVIIDPPPAREEPLLFLHTTTEYDRARVLAVGKDAKEEKYKGRTLYVGDKNRAVYPLDRSSLVYGSPAGIHALIDHPGAKTEGELADARRLAAGKHALTVGLNVKAFNESVGSQLPGEAEPFKPLLQATAGTLTLDLGAESRAVIRLHFSTEADAKAGVKPLRSGVELATAGLDRGIVELSKQKDAAPIVELFRQAQNALKTARVEQQGHSLLAAVNLKIDTAATGVALLAAVQKARGAASQAQIANNLKQIGIAMHNYHSANGHFPPHATYDKNGKPMLSWRVLILPYIEQDALYKQFHLEEPWDSEHNKKLLAMMPRTYGSPEDEKTLRDHTTHYQGFVGGGAFFESKKKLTLADFFDGTSNTVMIVEAAKAVPWSKPEDIPYDPAKELPRLGLPGASRFLAAFCDGSVRFLANTIKPMTLRNLITRNDGNIINPNDL